MAGSSSDATSGALRSKVPGGYTCPPTVRLLAATGDYSTADLSHLHTALRRTSKPISGAYIGCFEDSAQRDLQVSKGRMAESSVDQCAALCQGYLYFALQDRTECYCDNDFEGSHRRPTHFHAPVYFSIGNHQGNI